VISMVERNAKGKRSASGFCWVRARGDSCLQSRLICGRLGRMIGTHQLTSPSITIVSAARVASGQAARFVFGPTGRLLDVTLPPTLDVSADSFAFAGGKTLKLRPNA
jgi:hypothetical protein